MSPLYTKASGAASLDERDAKNEGPTSITHLWHMENATRTMHIVTYLDMSRGEEIIQPDGHEPVKIRVCTSWERSINALVFAQHITKGGYLAPLQLRNLLQDWEGRNRLGPRLQWCAVGYGVRSDTRYIATTSGNEQLRFFEVGNLADRRRVLVRHRDVSLFECVKLAMEKYRDDANWIIIA
jgi:hypothetical protein